jgi:hypothetical protein
MANEAISVVDATADVAMDEATASAFSTTLAALAMDNSSLSPIDLERAKVRTLQRQLTRCQEENRELQSMLKQTQTDLERQIQQKILIQKKQLIRTRIQDLNEESVAPDPCDDVQALKDELSSTQKNFADELEISKKREAKISHLQEQLDSLKQRRIQEEMSEEKKNDVVIKNLKKQRSELFAVIHKQVKLIDVLRQQRSHVEAATLLNITEKDFLKVVGSR